MELGTVDHDLGRPRAAVVVRGHHEAVGTGRMNNEQIFLCEDCEMELGRFQVEQQATLILFIGQKLLFWLNLVDMLLMNTCV